MSQDIAIPIVLGVILIMITLLIMDRFKTSMVFLGSMAVLMACGILSPITFVAGLSNTSIITIFLLIAITYGINKHFNPAVLLDKFFGNTRTLRGFIFKMTAGAASISSIMNNTPLVAMLMPYVYGWGKKHNISPSRLLIPLSYAAIVGGVITLIGTSTNLVLNSLLESSDLLTLDFSDFLIPGLLVTAAAIAYMYIFAPFLLKDNKDLLDHFEENTRQYLVETMIINGSPIAGKTVEEAGLRNLKGIYLTELVRGKEYITPVSPNKRLQEGDILLFAGETSQIFDLLNDGKGLELSKKQQFNLADNPDLYEAVITQNSSLDHKTVRELGFRDKFDAAIVGIHRRGEKLSGKIGAMILHTGDLLLLSAGKDFNKGNHIQEDLIIINTLQASAPLSRTKRFIFWSGLTVALILGLAGITTLFESLLLVLFSQFIVGMLNVEDLKKNISFDLLIILISALALGQVFIDSGAAAMVTDVFFEGVSSWHPMLVLGGIFLVTYLLTSLIANIAAISIIFPVVFYVVESTGIPEKALYLTAAFAASCCFATPIAYQTNLMVLEAGNYKFRDFLRIGLPLSILYAAVFLAYAAVKFPLV